MFFLFNFFSNKTKQIKLKKWVTKNLFLTNIICRDRKTNRSFPLTKSLPSTTIRRIIKAKITTCPRFQWAWTSLFRFSNSFHSNSPASVSSYLTINRRNIGSQNSNRSATTRITITSVLDSRICCLRPSYYNNNSSISISLIYSCSTATKWR